MAMSTVRRKVLSIALGSLLVVLIATLATLNNNLRFLNPSTTAEIFVFTALSAVVFLVFVAVLVMLVRNVLKLYADQRSRVMGTRLRTRMLWGAVLVSLLPLVFMATFSYVLMNRAVDHWFSTPVTEMRDDSNQMALELSRYTSANARAEADSIAASLSAIPLGGTQEGLHSFPGNKSAHASAGESRKLSRLSRHNSVHAAHAPQPLPTAPAASDRADIQGAEIQHVAIQRVAIQRVLEQHEITLQGGFALIFRDGHAIAAYHLPQRKGTTAEVTPWVTPSSTQDGASEDDSQLSSTAKGTSLNNLSGTPDRSSANEATDKTDATDASILATAQRSDLPVFTLGRTDYALSTAGLQHDGIVVVGLPMPYGMAATMTRLRAAADTYWTLFRGRRQIRSVYMELLLMMTSLALFASTWLALHLSKQVTKPVEALADAMDQIAQGDYAHRVEESATEELGDLVHSFNRMVADLESSRAQVEESTVAISRANAALEVRRTELETMLETIPNGVATLDASRRIVLANRALSEMMDPGGQRIFLGATIEELLPAELVETLDRLIRRSHRMGSASSELELKLDRTGDTLNLLATVALLEDTSATERVHRGYVVVLEDATELLHAQKQSAWKEVARRVAHEIKNPLTPISLSAEQIHRHIGRLAETLATHQLESPSPAIIRRCSEVITSSVESMRSLVDQFAALAEFPAARPRPADLNTIVENSLALFAGRLQSIRLITRFDRNLPLVLADPEALKRALGNLIDNAAEAMQTSLLRELRITTRLIESGRTPGSPTDGRSVEGGSTEGRLVELTVADTGSGLTDEMRERLFLPYFSTKQRGTGLGLAIAAKIIQEHQGTIRAEKNQPIGAKFIVELRPVLAAESEPASELADHTQTEATHEAEARTTTHAETHAETQSAETQSAAEIQIGGRS